MPEMLVSIAVLALVVLCVPICLYLAALTIAAPFGMRRRSQNLSPSLRFGILVPAHNEARVIGRLLASLAGLDYPAELVRVALVADNCSDATAALARTAGAIVFERQDSEHAGKGWALSWLLSRLRDARFDCDAYLVVDADCVLSANFLAVMNDLLLAGHDIIQAYYSVLPGAGTWVESLREASLALVHFLRPAAKTAIGASCGLKGTGMAFRREILASYGWPAKGLAEDVEFHLRLVAAGLRVTFAPHAVVRGEMPASLRAAESQNRRWEAGRLATIFSSVLPLLRLGARRRSLVQFDAALEQLTPPLSVPAIVLAACFIGGLVLRQWIVWLPAVAMLAILTVHVLAGLVLARVPWRVYRALAAAPAYAGWKMGLYARLLVKRHEGTWIRTARQTLD